MNRSDVLIVGAGPTGLVLALWLTKLGVKVRIDRQDRRSRAPPRGRWRCRRARWSSTASSTWPTRWSQRGHKIPAVNLWVKGEQGARVCRSRPSART